MGDTTAPDPSSGTLLAVAALFSVAALALSAVHIYLHLKNFTERVQQRFIVRILFIVPAYALGSWLSLKFPDAELYLVTIRDIYEAYVVYCFLALVLVYCGGDSTCVAKMQDKGSMRHLWPLCRLPVIPLGGRFLRRCKQSVLQFVIIKPIFAILSLIFLGIGEYDSFVYQGFLLFVYNVSYSLALYALLLFYMATREQLSAFNPVCKFFAVKAVVFMTYWQGLVVSLMPGVPEDDRGKWESFILCVEMCLFAILHFFAFSYRDFKLREGVLHTTVLQNVKSVINQRDVMQDAYHNFMPSYQDYVLHRPHSEGPPRKYRAKTFLFGNLGGAKRKTLAAEDSLALNGSTINLDEEDDHSGDDHSDDAGAHSGLGTQLDVSAVTDASTRSPAVRNSSDMASVSVEGKMAVRGAGTHRVRRIVSLMDDEDDEAEEEVKRYSPSPVGDEGVAAAAAVAAAIDPPPAPRPSSVRVSTPRSRGRTAAGRSTPTGPSIAPSAASASDGHVGRGEDAAAGSLHAAASSPGRGAPGAGDADVAAASVGSGRGHGGATTPPSDPTPHGDAARSPRTPPRVDS